MSTSKSTTISVLLKMRMRYTAPLLAAVITVIVVVVVLVTGSGTATPPVANALHPVASASPRPPALNLLPTDAPAPIAGSVASDLAVAARNPGIGGQLDGEVVDATSGDVLWAQDVDDLEPPASTTKLLTATAALLTLGPDARLSTTTVRAGSTVFLVGGGDVTLVGTTTPKGVTSYPPPASLADLAHQTATALAAAGIRRVQLRADAAAWSGPRLARGWSPSYVTEGDIAPPSALEVDEGRTNPASPFAARSPTPVLQATDVFAGFLRQDGIRVRGRVSGALAPPGAAPLGRVQSAPVAQLVQRMLTTSDDDLAEALGRAVAIHVGRPADFTGAAAAVTAKVESIGVPADAISLRDTSGLSHRDRLTARSLVVVLRAAIRNPLLRPVLEGLPVAGLTGTLATRYATLPASRAAGVLRAKTGTLSGVNALAGELVDRSGRLLVFAFLAPHAPSAGTTEGALDALAARLVRCGCGVAS
jgi:D-alanyl-D-alanine carboxypeptidase/D-alanyl-D-alanine-endopeptidase (penicillin-binding protein 4)